MESPKRKFGNRLYLRSFTLYYAKFCGTHVNALCAQLIAVNRKPNGEKNGIVSDSNQCHHPNR